MSAVNEFGYDIANPASTATIAAGATAGSMGTGGNYSYKFTYVTAFGETAASAASNAVTTATGSMSLTLIPVSPNSNVTGRKIYRTAVGGSTYYYLATLSQSPAVALTTYTDSAADAALGVATAPAVNTASSLATIQGNVALSKPPCFPLTNSITAGAGGTQGVAVPLTTTYNIITTVTTLNDSVLLPPLNANLIGTLVVVRNNGALASNVFPYSGQTINALGADTAISCGAAATLQFIAATASNWRTF